MATKKDNNVEEINLDQIDLTDLKKAWLDLDGMKSLNIWKNDKLVTKEDIKEDIESAIMDLEGGPDKNELENIEKTSDWEEIALSLQKERWLNKLPKDRDEDKRRVWKWLKEFINVTVSEKDLEWMPETIQELMKKGKKEGSVTQNEVMSALPNAENDLDLLDEVYTRFIELKIEIVDNLDKDNLFNIDRKSKKSKKESISLSEISDDSIRMYLNEILKSRITYVWTRSFIMKTNKGW